MLFSSLTFLVYFLPTVLIVSYLLSKCVSRDLNICFLVVGSFIFYSWNFPPHFVLLASSIAGNFVLGNLLLKHPRKWLLVVGVAGNLMLLGWFKYAGLVVSTITDITGSSVVFGAIALPLAISFFTFQQIAYLVDIYRKEIKPGNFLEYTFFISFFPQLIAGPIVHYKEMIPQLKQSRFLRFCGLDLVAGALLFSIGLAKKVLIADELRFGADQIFNAAANGIEPSMIESWIGVLCYSFQIYFDFSGYSDMALGLGRMFGIKLPVNFFSPYKSTSIIDFWRRWNITLSHFLRDYLYYALGGNRKGKVLRYANLFVVMLLGGLWHGASWTFVVWGGLHGLYLMINHAWRHFYGKPLSPFIAIPLTFGAVAVAWVFFRADNFTDAFTILTAMFALGSQSVWDMGLFHEQLSLYWMLVVAAMIVWLLPNMIELIAKYERSELSNPQINSFVIAGALLFSISFFKVYSIGTYEFLYFQF